MTWRLSTHQEEETVQVDKLVPLIGPDLSRCEKNWMPIVMGGGLHMIYSYDPFVLFKTDVETGKNETA